ncbi:MAG TPA: TadE family protein [Gemmatimonadales bacterium]|nr:TadE family protein [Gemmatimonadales bacterium]
MKRLHQDTRGQAMVEFALVLPLLLILLIGVFEFGRAWNVYHAVTDAARLGARSAVVADPVTTQDSVYAIVRRALSRAAIDTNNAAISMTGWRTGSGTPASINIQVPYQFVFLKPFMHWSDNKASITLQSTFVMRNE